MGHKEKWRVWCEDEAGWQEHDLALNSPEPTTCPNDVAHSIDAVRTYLYHVAHLDDIDAATHSALRQLIHLADGVGGPFEGFATGAYREVLPAGEPFPTSTIWWVSSSKTDKIVEKTVVRNSNRTPATVEYRVYDIDGSTVLAIVTDTFEYQGVFETSRTRAIQQ